MLTTILDEAVNGWILTVFGGLEGKQAFVYEHLVDAQCHRARVEDLYEFGRLKGVQENASYS